MMGGVTAYVREALSALGGDASPSLVKRWISEKYPVVPQSQVGLALRKLQESARRSQPRLRNGEPFPRRD